MKMLKSIGKFFGMNSVAQSKVLPDQAATDVQDFVMTPGALSTRPGFRKQNATAYANAILGIFDFKPILGMFMLLFHGEYVIRQTILTPNFAAGPRYGTAPLTCVFLDITNDPYGEIDGWLWEFGDGSQSTEHYPVHTYAAAGTYTVTLTVKAGASLAFTATKKDYILVVPAQPYDGTIIIPPVNPNWPIPEQEMKVDSITPNYVYEGYETTPAVIAGQGFSELLFQAAGLFSDLLTSLYAMTDIVWGSITGNIAAGLGVGKYDVIVVNKDGNMGMLEDGFEVLAVPLHPMYVVKNSGYTLLYQTVDKDNEGLIAVGGSILLTGGWVPYPVAAAPDKNGSVWVFGSHGSSYPYQHRLYKFTNGVLAQTITLPTNIQPMDLICVGDYVYASWQQLPSTPTMTVRQYVADSGAVWGTYTYEDNGGSAHMDTDGQYIYIANYGTQEFMMFDQYMRLLHTGYCPMGDTPWGVAFDGEYVWVLWCDYSYYYALKFTQATATLIETVQWAYGDGFLGFAVDENYFYLSDGSSVFKYSKTDGAFVSSFDGGGNKLYLQNWDFE